jgi:hypothetical protein
MTTTHDAAFQDSHCTMDTDVLHLHLQQLSTYLFAILHQLRSTSAAAKVSSAYLHCYTCTCSKLDPYIELYKIRR